VSILARYSGACPECGERWQPGDPIRYSGSERIWQPPRWVHGVRPEPTDPTTLRLGERACAVCRLVHPEGECDR